jgi:hypothetical protein
MTDPEPIFLVSYDRLTWLVTLDGARFGTYRSKQNAIKSVNEARATPRLQNAVVVMGAADGA